MLQLTVNQWYKESHTGLSRQGAFVLTCPKSREVVPFYCLDGRLYNAPTAAAWASGVAENMNVKETCAAKGRRKGSLSGFIIRRPINSEAAQCQALTADPSNPLIASTARFSLNSKTSKRHEREVADDIRSSDSTKLLFSSPFLIQIKQAIFSKPPTRRMSFGTAADAAAVEAWPLPLPNGRPLLAAGGADPPPCLPISLFCISFLHLCCPRKTEREDSL
nr:hypothetical protein Iba_chr12aCG21930 [Ipomoea batatas]